MIKKVLFCLLLPLIGIAQPTLDQADKLLQQKHYKQAENLLKPFVAQNNSSKRAVELLGDTYGHQANWDAAITQYKQLVALDQNEANYYYKYGGAMGMKALEVNKFSALLLIDDIEKSFLKAAELDSKHINTRWALVELYMKLPAIVGGSIKKSLKYADELEGISKVDGYLAKGTIYEYDKKPDLAEKYYKMAVNIGGSVTCYEKLASFYENQNQPEKALLVMEASKKSINKI
ncbi:tetratricopeptide repeat protein [Bizionia myxarmorum]|uniref:Tetratricopeptide repeat protein n=1 Tax=Bizionia myxarmorum TaxID=291186 RepID=A0A5D0REE9_9FLAO|nr:tetratricopeptide repeat protein [Bizionia myxarmorum]TYB79326.1 tetratricopeptide repeat protein [Bizionia myxarmorum]